MSRTKNNSRKAEPVAARQRIADATIAEILKTGVLGLRIANIAKVAGVSIPLIYKYFGNRESLIAEVLGVRIAHDFIEDNNLLFSKIPQDSTRLDPQVIAGLMPKPEEQWRQDNRWLRIEAKAASRRIPELRARLSKTIEEIESESERIIIAARAISKNASPVPARTIAWAIISFADGFANRDLTEKSVDDESYLLLITDFLQRHVL